MHNVKKKQTPCLAETAGKHHCILPDSGGAAVSVSVSPLGINRLWVYSVFVDILSFQNCPGLPDLALSKLRWRPKI